MSAPWIYLASASPRRRELLRQIGVSYRRLRLDVDETPRLGETPDAYVVRLALAKARTGCATLGRRRPAPVLGADTAVVLGDQVLGKPRDRAEALTMLLSLAGREHRVLTGVALVDGGSRYRLSVSRVRFRPLSEAEALAYWDTGEPADKAGGYGIQGLGALFVQELSGSYSGVMGLPLFEVAQLLAEAGLPRLAPPGG